MARDRQQQPDDSRSRTGDEVNAIVTGAHTIASRAPLDASLRRFGNKFGRGKFTFYWLGHAQLISMNERSSGGRGMCPRAVTWNAMF